MNWTTKPSPEFISSMSGRSKGRSAGGHELPHRGITNEWHTPQYILDALGPFDDDPAMPGQTDGLTRPWNGFVWCNPPYGPECGRWLRRMSDHNNGIALVFARTETRWFKNTVWDTATALKFLHKRIHFVRDGKTAKGNSGAPSVLVAYGEKAAQRLKECLLEGPFIAEWFDE